VQGKMGPKTKLSDVVTVHDPKEEIEAPLPVETAPAAPAYVPAAPVNVAY
jgi:hypothetical protein